MSGHPNGTDLCSRLKLLDPFLAVPALQWLQETPAFEHGR